jgi:hypothetical protein
MNFYFFEFVDPGSAFVQVEHCGYGSVGCGMKFYFLEFVGPGRAFVQVEHCGFGMKFYFFQFVGLGSAFVQVEHCGCGSVSCDSVAAPPLLEPAVAHDEGSREVGGLQHCHSHHCVLTLTPAL